jgi:hypothetical protein
MYLLLKILHCGLKCFGDYLYVKSCGCFLPIEKFTWKNSNDKRLHVEIACESGKWSVKNSDLGLS